METFTIRKITNKNISNSLRKHGWKKSNEYWSGIKYYYKRFPVLSINGHPYHEIKIGLMYVRLAIIIVNCQDGVKEFEYKDIDYIEISPSGINIIIKANSSRVYYYKD